MMKSQVSNVVMLRDFVVNNTSKSLCLILFTVCFFKTQDCFNFNRIRVQSNVDLIVEKDM